MKLPLIFLTALAILALACQPEMITPEEIQLHCEQISQVSMDHRLERTNRLPYQNRFLEMPANTFIQHDTLEIFFVPPYRDSVQAAILSHQLEITGEGLEILQDSVGEQGWGSIVQIALSEPGSYTLTYVAEIDQTLFREEDSLHCGPSLSEPISISIEVIGRAKVVIHQITVDLPEAICNYDIALDDVKKCPDVQFHINALSVHSSTSTDYNFQQGGPLTKVLEDTVSVIENYWQISMYVDDNDGLLGKNRGMANFVLVPEKMGFWQSGTYTLSSNRWERGTAEIEITRVD